MNRPCECEHVSHFTKRLDSQVHAYGDAEATLKVHTHDTGAWNICNYCAESCLVPFIKNTEPLA